MKSQTSIVSRNYRLKEWAQMIRDCNNRPAGMSIDEWCEANSIKKANYYYRMTQVRKACLDSLDTKVPEQTVVPVPLATMTNNINTNEEAYIELVSYGVTLRVTENTSTELLLKILGVLANVE